ncbi:methylphosphotriester-DNA--protein-cysteine methyltransferase family protein [bacterium AH-315-J21]|nr:methylphosphotriester-DNA--protein-cysteine methyltransferase family protein [bacterium AH-315-J21]
MARAMRESDGGFDGRFYVGVHSTRIYCLPSCPAKLPLLKNVRFYATRELAIAAGLRGCKRCKSEFYPDVLPAWYHAALKYMKANLTEKLDEEKLMRLTGVEISTLRRTFSKRIGQTPLAFHRELRLRQARKLIEDGADYLGAGFDCGWESASGFRAAFEKQFGVTPGSIRKSRS